MQESSWTLSGDLAKAYVVAAVALAGLSLVLLALELRRKRRGWPRALAVSLSGLVAVLTLLFAVLRPVRVEARGASVGPRVVVLVDASRSIDLPSDTKQSRRQIVGQAFRALAERFRAVRLRVLAFGMGSPTPLSELGDSERDASEWLAAGRFDVPPQLGSDLVAGLDAVGSGVEELPHAMVVISDGRLDRPGSNRPGQVAKAATGRAEVPIHTIALAHSSPPDAAVRAARIAGAMVAHQPATLTVEVACTGGLSCSRIPVTVREHHQNSPPVLRASATALIQNGYGSVDLELVLDRTGKRIVEIAIQAPGGDEIPENDERYLTIDVARDRVRLLHIAGRPTYDVRALRTWLKSDASVDVVAFFILRTSSDDVNVVSQDELALIPFPVDELFTDHLPSFDAVILQDFDAMPYGLSKHLRALARYVRRGGGLIMVGGPNAFVSGHYARTPLAEVLPVSLATVDPTNAVDFGTFVPQMTEAGRRAPVLEPLRALVGEQLAQMPGTNIVDEARGGATVLLTHPNLRTAAGTAMPVLALGEYGSGRSIALTVDGSHKLLFSAFAIRAGGRAHGAFWDGLLGWLMRDPRFEPASVRLPQGCIAGRPVTLMLRTAFGGGAAATVTVSRMGSGDVVGRLDVALPEGDKAVPVQLGPLAAGGYVATVQPDKKGQSTPSRYDFACEVGGDEWADPRPDADRLAHIAAATDGVAVDVAGISDIPLPKAVDVVAEQRVHPVLPPWCWSLIAASCLGGHWLLRRKTGLS